MRADFVLIGLSAALALLLVRGSSLAAEIRSRPRAVALALGAVALGAAPMLLSAVDLLTVQSGIADRGDLAYRARVLWSSLDGSYDYPFTHLLVAAVLVSLARLRAGRALAVLAALAALAVLAVLVSSARVTFETRELIAETGGRGRYSNALDAFAAELAAGRPWVHSGDAEHRYLVFAPRYDLFQLGPKLLETARAPDPSDVLIREHRDREGEIAFYSVRFLRPHQLVYSGVFEVRFIGPPTTRSAPPRS